MLKNEVYHDAPVTIKELKEKIEEAIKAFLIRSWKKCSTV